MIEPAGDDGEAGPGDETRLVPRVRGGRFARGRALRPAPKRPKPKSGRQSVGASDPKASIKEARKEALATGLGVTEAELSAARALEGAASVGLAETTPANRRVRVAARLAITTRELKLLRRALAGPVLPAERSSASALVRAVAKRGLAPDRVKVPDRVRKQPGSTPAAKVRSSRKPPRTRQAGPGKEAATDSLTPRERQVRLANRLRAAGSRRAPNWWVGGE